MPPRYVADISIRYLRAFFFPYVKHVDDYHHTRQRRYSELIHMFAA